MTSTIVVNRRPIMDRRRDCPGSPKTSRRKGSSASRGKKFLKNCKATPLDDLKKYIAFVFVWRACGGKISRVNEYDIKSNKFLISTRRVELSYAPMDFGPNPPILFSPGLISFDNRTRDQIISTNKEGRVRYTKFNFGDAIIYGWICDEYDKCHIYASGPLPVWSEVEELMQDKQALIRGAYSLDDHFLKCMESLPLI